MLCSNPYIQGMHCFPCGQCMPCRFNRRRMWTHRIMLEAVQRTDNCFITLTYDEDHLPPGGSLAPEEARNWLKRFRKSVAPSRIRYYLVGEYGDQTHRPHYHAAIFGYPSCSCASQPFVRRRTAHCAICDNVRSTWGLGEVFVGTLEVHSAQYIAGYVTKKMTAPGDPRLNGRYPEFARMSLRPGIGADAMHEVASVLMELGLDTTEGDVPSALRHGSRTLPLGRYLRRKLRLLLGKDEKAPDHVLIEQAAEMHALFQTTLDAPPGTSFKQAAIKSGHQGRLNMEAKQRIFKKDKSL